MHIKWNGTEPTMVRPVKYEPKVEVEAGGVVECTEEQGKALLQYSNLFEEVEPEVKVVEPVKVEPKVEPVKKEVKKSNAKK
jgi:hypothetical protein